ncbi:hypothetical protein [Burkholderia sp. Ac-20365]|uniref:hypothetical protein n=1 Tax=Burkholderia sp. Ac-20365 TaxID=2703897 RepID=UPI00197B6DD9|nr:hypothetical protein [Burkholderia sp. Ac-20365]MBN3761228.1 hypothetical protein [Burkholderia sp. Ac-20365]
MDFISVLLGLALISALSDGTPIDPRKILAPVAMFAAVLGASMTVWVTLEYHACEFSTLYMPCMTISKSFVMTVLSIGTVAASGVAMLSTLTVISRGSASTIVVSEPDVQAALTHLRLLPFRENGPVAWDRQYVIKLIREAAGSTPKVGDCLEIGPGVFGVVRPFGADLADGPYAQGRLQVWIAVRSAGTDPSNVSEL